MTTVRLRYNVLVTWSWGIVLCSVVLSLGCSMKKRCQTHLDDFAAYLDARIDATELRTWTTNLLHRYDEGESPKDALPESLSALNEGIPYIAVQKPGRREKLLMITWRTDYGGRGLLVGSEDAKILKGDDPCEREWKPGIVMFCSIGE